MNMDNEENIIATINSKNGSRYEVSYDYITQEVLIRGGSIHNKWERLFRCDRDKAISQAQRFIDENEY